jgi:glycosyltransferase involved in cell wall biosynthesis
MIEVSIVSGTYDRLAYLQKMVYSVRASAAGLSYEIVLCDGGSTDGTLDWIARQTDIRLIKHGNLRGAIAAFNDAAAIARGQYVILANDDLWFVGDAVRRAVDYMASHAETGIGCFYTNRAGRGDHVAEMPAHHADGSFTSVPYGGIVIIPRWLGDKLTWWTCPGARTYGGDNALCSRAIEAGWPVVKLEGCKVNESIPGDALNAVNNPPSSEEHPDTRAYLKLFPRGPELDRPRAFDAPAGPRRILYAPIYEHGHVVQHQQKRGLRRALQRIGLVREIDYAATGPDAILDMARAWQPDLVLAQCHYADPFTIGHAARLREMLPGAKLVNWKGDVYNMATHPQFGADYCAMLRHFDLQTTVNATEIPDYSRQGVRAAYWQIGYEPDGIGHESDAATPRHDVIFMGNGYSDHRQAFGTFLRSLPYNVGLYGTYWPTQGANGETLYDFRRGCQLYRAARIALGDAEWRSAARGFVSNRPFQAMAAGNCLMLQEWFDGCEDLLHLIDGQHLVLWRGTDDLRDKIAYYLDPAHEAERAAIARVGQHEVLVHHSFEARVSELLDILKTLDNRPAGVPPQLIGVDYA